MKTPFKFTLVEIAPLEEFLQLTPGERIRRNDQMAARLIEIEEFMEIFNRGHKFIKSHGNPS